jgi:plastocyanin
MFMHVMEVGARRGIAFIALCVLLFGAVSCGGGGDEDVSPAAQEEEADNDDAGTEEEEADEENDEADKACLEGPHDGKKVTVVADDFFFKPKKIEAKAGDKVTIAFENVGKTPHSFTLENPACDTDPRFADEPAKVTFIAPDQDAKFICTVHPNMTGELLIR